ADEEVAAGYFFQDMAHIFRGHITPIYHVLAADDLGRCIMDYLYDVRIVHHGRYNGHGFHVRVAAKGRGHVAGHFQDAAVDEAMYFAVIAAHSAFEHGLFGDDVEGGTG